MAEFVERAILEVTDRSTQNVAKINAELRKLRKTATDLKAAFSSLKLDVSGVRAATTAARELTTALKRVGSTPVKVKVDYSSVLAATRAANGLKSALEKAGAVKVSPAARTAQVSAPAPARATAAAGTSRTGTPAWALSGRMLVRQLGEDAKARRSAEAAAVADAGREASARRDATRRLVARLTEEKAAREQAAKAGVAVEKAALAEAARIDSARMEMGRRLVARLNEEKTARERAARDAIRAEKAAAAEASRVDNARWASARALTQRLAAEQRARVTEERRAEAQRNAATRHLITRLTEEKNARERAARDALRAERTAASEQIREARRADVEARRSEASQRRAAIQAAAYWRNSNPVILRMRAEDAEARRAAGVQARREARQALGLTPATGNADSVGFSIGSAFARAAHNAANEIGRRIAYAYAAGTGDAVKSEEVARARIGLQNPGAAITGDARRIAAETARNVPGITRGEALGLTAEILPGVLNDTRAARELAPKLAEMAAVQQTLGVSASQANEKALLVFKAFAQTGQVFDAHGKIDIPAVQKSFENYNRAVIQVGREVDPTRFFTLEKNLGAAKYNLSQSGLIGALIVQENLGAPKTGVGYNQLVKQLQGYGAQAYVIDNLAKAGLINTQEVKKGSVGKSKQTKVVSTGSKFGNELQEDPAKFVRERIIPVMRANGMDPTDVAAATAIARKFTSDRTATNLLIELIVNAQEIEQQTRMAIERQIDMKKAMEDSLLLARNNLVAKATTLGADVIEAFRVPIAAVTNAGASVAGLLSDYIAPNGLQLPGRALSVAAGGAGLAVGGAVVGGKVLQAFNPLNASAVALNGSAAALTGAAKALTLSGNAQSIKTNAALTAAGLGTTPVPAGGWSNLGRVAARVGGGAVAGAALGAVSVIVDEDKMRGAAGLFGSVAGGAIGAALGGPAGAMIGATLGGEIAKGIYSILPESITGATGFKLPPMTPSGMSYTTEMLNMVRAAETETQRLTALAAQRDAALAAGNETARASADGAIAASKARIAAYKAEIDRLDQLRWKAPILIGEAKIRQRESPVFNPGERQARMKAQAEDVETAARLARNKIDGEREGANARARMAADQIAADLKAAKIKADYQAKYDQAAADRQAELRDRVARQLREQLARSRAIRLLTQASPIPPNGGPVSPSQTLQHPDEILPGIDGVLRSFDELFGRSLNSGADTTAAAIEGAFSTGGQSAASAISAALAAGVNINLPAPLTSPAAAETGTTMPR